MLFSLTHGESKIYGQEKRGKSSNGRHNSHGCYELNLTSIPLLSTKKRHMSGGTRGKGDRDIVSEMEVFMVLIDRM